MTFGELIFNPWEGASLRVVSLFSGIGAHDLGLEWAGMQIVGQVEIDDYCTKILEKHWPNVKRWRDITTVSANDIRRLKPDLITGGFPCQDVSTAGKQKGIVEGERSGLWREMWRIIRDVRPDWLLIENVPALRVKGADSVLGALEACLADAEASLPRAPRRPKDTHS